MIHKVHIQNFKSLRDVSVELERFTVFVGANGSGKTSVLKAIDLVVHAEPDMSGWTYLQNSQMDWVYTRGGRGNLAITSETAHGPVTLEVEPPEEFLLPPEPLSPQRWKFRLTAPEGTSVKEAQGSVRPLIFLQMNAARLAEPSYSDLDHPRLESDGTGIASVLAYMALNDPDGFDELMNHVRGLLPQIKRIRFRKVPVLRSEIESITIGTDAGERRTHRTFQGEAILFDFHHASDVSASSVSEGTLMILGLLTVLLGPGRPRSLLLDDIEHGLHPLAQKRLVELIGRVLERFPDLQVLATAHSPYLLDYVAPEQVRIMALDEDGHARCGRLTDHPKFETWKEEMAPGEMWSVFGEKWVTESEVRS